MGNVKLGKSKTYQLVDLHEYVPQSVVSHPIFIKSTGNISIISYDAGVTKEGKKSPFDAFIQVIEGEAEIRINDQSHLLKTGQVIIIPAHSANTISAIGKGRRRSGRYGSTGYLPEPKNRAKHR